MSLISLVNRTFADVITEVLNPVPQRLMLTNGEVNGRDLQAQRELLGWRKLLSGWLWSNFTVKAGKDMKQWLGRGLRGKGEVAFKVVSIGISSAVDEFIEERNRCFEEERDKLEMNGGGC